ncbi:hypothetical protein [Deinococcus sp.]|uniref:hypothetical protein n=1 Tax=Deinococcus sp. TaxID=47478 RepID=UPI003CC69CD9
MRPLVPLLLLLLSLNACAGPPLTEARGQVIGWTYGAGRAEFLSDDLHTLSSAPLESVGRFNLKLPDAAALAPYLQGSLVPEVSAGCTSSVKADPPTARFYSQGDITVYPGTAKHALTLVSEDRGSAEPLRVVKRLYLYATQNVRVTGDLSCAANGQNAAANYSLDLKAGWNRVASNQTLYRSGASQISLLVVGADGFEHWRVAK